MKMRSTTAILLVSGAIISASTVSRAAVIASYGFTSGSTASSDADTNSTTSNIAAGSGVTLSVTGVGYGYVLMSDTVDTLAGAIANNDYVSFTITPAAGYQLNLTSLTYSVFAGTSDPTSKTQQGTYTENIVFRSSLTGATNLSTGQCTYINSTGSSGTATTVPVSDSLPAALSNVTGPVTFSFYLYDNATNYGRDLFDDITVNGSVTSTPEPSLIAFCGLAAAGLLRRRTRRS